MPLPFLPSGQHTVTLRAVNAGADLVCATKSFVEPVIDGHETPHLPTLVWLIENNRTGQKIIFDNGTRKDFWNLAPAAQDVLRLCIPHMHVGTDVPTVLEQAGYVLNEISAVIWSHHHLDHTGDVSLYPRSTELVLGPGIIEAHLPGYPANPQSELLESDFAGRAYREINFDSDFRIGTYRAHDFFSDGSFYLLDTPGHSIGHMCGLARTTKTDFVLLGGDVCHFPGSFRPSKDIPLPKKLPASAGLDREFPSPCLSTTFTSMHPCGHAAGNTTPFYQASKYPESIYQDAHVANQSTGELRNFDASPNVFVCIAHDPTLLRVLPTINEDSKSEVGDWKAKGYKEACHWGWLNELPRSGAPGRPKMVTGYASGGVPVEYV